MAFRPLRLGWLLAALCIAGSASAQSVSTGGAAPDEATGSLSGSWIGHARCGSLGWALLHEIRESGDGTLISDYSFVGSVNAGGEVDILPLGDGRFLFDARNPAIYDFVYRTEGDRLIGEARGGDCETGLVRRVAF